MITTLLKHEWIRTRGIVLSIAAIATLAVGIATLLTLTGWPLIAGFGAGMGLVAVIAMVPVTQIVLAVDFWSSGFRRTGYFTHSLPVRGTTIYWAKALWGVAVSLAAAVVNVLLLALFWLALGPTLTLDANLFAALGDLFEMVPAWFAASMAAFVVIGLLGFLAQLYFAATLGSGPKLQRLGLGGPIIVYIATYMAGQVLVFACILAIPLGLDLSASGFEVVPFNVLGELVSGASPSQDVMPVGFVPPLLAIFVVTALWAARRWGTRIALA